MKDNRERRVKLYILRPCAGWKNIVDSFRRHNSVETEQGVLYQQLTQLNC